MPRRERILPSGTVELVFNLHDDQVRIDGTVKAARPERLPALPCQARTPVRSSSMRCSTRR
jgi:hypothetical protein